MLGASFIATVVIFLSLITLGGLLLAVMHFGGLVAYTILLFLVFWFIVYIGMATYQIEKEIEGEDDED
jgi:fatty acid desaturase